VYPHRGQHGRLDASQQHRDSGRGLSAAGEVSSALAKLQMRVLENVDGPVLRAHCMREYGWDASKAREPSARTGSSCK
jgi:hypothetical protein